MTGEISHDLVMEADMTFAEGTYRIGDGPWQVYIVSKGDVAAVVVTAATWDSGVSGFHFMLPRASVLDSSLVERLLSGELGVTHWTEVRGPDSIDLR